MAITRRQFLQRTVWATAGALVGPSLFRNPLLQNALAASDNYLVILNLDGGNDGLNTIAPADNGFVGAGGLRDLYQAARLTGTDGLQLPSSGTGGLLVPLSPAPPMIDVNTGSQLGFHPGLQALKTLYDAGNVAVIQGVGYPNPNLSHDESGRKWQTGDPNGVLGVSGWMGRYLTDNFGGNDIPAVSIRDTVAGEFLNADAGVLALRRVTDFAFPYGSGLSSSERSRYAAAFAAIHADATASSLVPFSYTGSTGTVAQEATLAYPFLSNEYKAARASYDAQYSALNTGTATNLREIAKVIWGVANDSHPGVVTARIFETRQGGYDTHSDQGAGSPGDQQFARFQEMARAIALFYDDVNTMQPGLGAKVSILVWSEFSRRISQNASGTDHGSQGPVFLIGGAVNGGVYGNHPNIDPMALNSDGNTVYSQAAGDGFRSTDLRDIYGTILRHAFNVADPTTLLPVDGGSAATHWTAPDFDMPLYA